MVRAAKECKKSERRIEEGKLGTHRREIKDKGGKKRRDKETKEVGRGRRGGDHKETRE